MNQPSVYVPILISVIAICLTFYSMRHSAKREEMTDAERRVAKLEDEIKELREAHKECEEGRKELREMNAEYLRQIAEMASRQCTVRNCDLRQG